jgi:hypothetical protein
LAWFPGHDTAWSLYWSNQPDCGCVSDILTFGQELGLHQICFEFFAEYETLFSGSHAIISKQNIEMYRTI